VDLLAHCDVLVVVMSMCCGGWCVLGRAFRLEVNYGVDCGKQRRSLVEIRRVTVWVEQHYSTSHLTRQSSSRLRCGQNINNNVMSATAFITVLRPVSDPIR
jgi:hypothetical protein